MTRPLLLTILLVLFASCSDSRRRAGTLTLVDDKLVFEADGMKQPYDAMSAPGIKAVSFDKRVQVKGDKETDISVLTVEFAESVALTNAVPIKVERIQDDSGLHWRLIEQ